MADFIEAEEVVRKFFPRIIWRRYNVKVLF